MWTVAALYKFIAIADREALQAELKSRCKALDVYGTLLVADEGINGTICAPSEENMKQIMDFILETLGRENMELKYSTAELRPFRRMKIRLKKEIVTLKQDHVDPTKQSGTYLSPKEWNEMLKNNPDMPVLDTRNDYEVEIGTFKNAIDPQTKAFTEFPEFVKKTLNPKKNKKVAMFCTGGIRCEKASSYMLAEGYEEVYHLKGGILQYLEDIPKEESLWDGECYVFDHRVSIAHGLEQGTYDYCFGCGFPISDTDKQHASFEDGISCKRCVDDLTPAKRKALTDRHTHLKTQKGVA
ncbi:MAG: hypothetical protein COB76_01870 [Alphaproteobacteria bacterium]|nr:MAG: hypothetical protein COB76_01870 [Alphaproteobacteria bacterium]